MGSYDYVKGVPAGYDDQVKLWDCEQALYDVGDLVPDVDGHSTYSVRLQNWSEETQPPRYINVEKGRIAEAGTEQPLSPVFSKWGGEEDQENPIETLMRKMAEDAQR